MTARTAAFAAVLLATMMMANISWFMIVVSSSELEAEFGLSKFELGLIGTFGTGSGALLSPMAGRLVERFGGARSMRVTLVVAAIGGVLTALAQSYVFLLVGMVVGGLAAGMGNPSTNRAIASSELGNLGGVITGVKQSGVQAAVLVSGFVLPLMIDQWGWRSGQWATAVAALALIAAVTVVPADPGGLVGGAASSATRAGHSILTIRTAVYGALLGFVGGGLGRFLPLYAEEVLELSLADAGRIFGIGGLVSIPVRIVSGRSIDRGFSAPATLFLMAVWGAVSVAIIAAADPGPNMLIWVGTVLNGITLGSWNTAANWIMIRQPNPGQSTGLLYMGFFAGISVGGPLIGWTIDATDSYNLAWIISGAVTVAGAVVIRHRSVAGA